jgi:tRNA (guanine-N7-)-methyltransferase
LIQAVRVSSAAGETGLAELGAPLPLEALVPPRAPAPADWEVELGFGKGRYLLRRCQEEPGHRFLGVELAAEYYRTLADRARRRGLANWLAVRGEALYLLSAVLPTGFAVAVHVYFPDPWPKSRHHKRRLFDSETVDLVLGLLRPGGRLFFATDFLEYGGLVAEILASYPGLRIARRDGPWDTGPRTNYEAKYLLEGRPILRLEGTLESPAALHPQGTAGVLASSLAMEAIDA